MMDSAPATVLSSTQIECVAPAWGYEFPVAADGVILSVHHDGGEGDLESVTSDPISEHPISEPASPVTQQSTTPRRPRSSDPMGNIVEDH